MSEKNSWKIDLCRKDYAVTGLSKTFERDSITASDIEVGKRKKAYQKGKRRRFWTTLLLVVFLYPLAPAASYCLVLYRCPSMRT